MKNLYISATGAQAGKSAVVLGFMGLLLTKIEKVAFFRPIIEQDGDWKDHDIELIRKYYKLDVAYDECYACTLSEARSLINSGQDDVLIAKILRKYKELEAKSDFVLCEGTDLLGNDLNFEFDLNTDIATHLGASLVLVSNAKGMSTEELVSTFSVNQEMCKAKGADILSFIFNMATIGEGERRALPDLTMKEGQHDIQIYTIPTNKILANPSVEEVKNWLKAKVLYGEERLSNPVSDYLIAAMQLGNFMNYINEGQLVITPADRADIILASLLSKTSNAYPSVSGLLLTGDTPLYPSIAKLIEGLPEITTPILSVGHHTYKTMSILQSLHGRIQAHDDKKINTAIALFENHTNGDRLTETINSHVSEKKSPMMFEFQIMEQARKQTMRIVLPEGKEERILRASEILLQRNVADIILLGNVAEIKTKAEELNLDIAKATIIDPEKSEYFDDFVETYCELRKAKGMTMETARDRMLDATYFGTMMVHKNLADGMVSGSINTTGHTVRPSLEFIKTKPGFSIVSSIFFMCLKDYVLTFGDCAINPDPNAEQLAEIAINAAETAKVFGLNPRVAMLSYSTGGSGKGADVDKVVEATKIARERAPELLIEGPIQYDAAIDPEVAKTKLPDSKVAGQATVFIFPDLNTGNNTYKAVQRAANAVAIGPVLQGLNKPVNDLSRGCTVADIVNTVAITAVQAQAKRT